MCALLGQESDGFLQQYPRITLFAEARIGAGFAHPTNVDLRCSIMQRVGADAQVRYHLPIFDTQAVQTIIKSWFVRTRSNPVMQKMFVKTRVAVREHARRQFTSQRVI